MSRCFPFPPPGYDKKIRTDEADSLVKEKQKKEKKHKKEKKDKEKKEGKEKKDKERSKDKHKEKEEKHKDRKEKDRDKEKSRTSDDKRADGVLPNLEDKEKPVTYTLQSNGNADSKFIQDLARRNRDEEKATRSESLQKNEQVENKDHVKKKELREDNHRRESVTKSDKPLDNEGIKRNEPKYITERSRKEEKTEVRNNIAKEKPACEEGGPRYNSVDGRNFRVEEDLSRARFKNFTSEGILSKRKDLETNGSLYENGFRQNKIHKASPISSTENGRKLGAYQTHPKPVSDMQGTVCDVKVKEKRVNGFNHSQEPKSHPSVSTVKAKENGEASSAKKRPHPDLKYLDQILNVPKREELRVDDDDEQGWLYDQSRVKLTKKQRADSSTSLDETTPQVWNQALRLDSADVVALPYVTPF